jgi:hypothetical protein
MESESELQDIPRWSESRINDWFERLGDVEPEDAFKGYIAELTAIYKNFLRDFNDPQLADLQGSSMSFNYYDQARIFAYTVDQALTRMPWGIAAKFALDIMEASQDLSLGQKPGFVAFAYSQNLSPFAIVSPDFLKQSVAEGSTVDAVNEAFLDKCDSYLQGGFKQ